jgi:hypothetical protein
MVWKHRLGGLAAALTATQQIATKRWHHGHPKLVHAQLVALLLVMLRGGTTRFRLFRPPLLFWAQVHDPTSPTVIPFSFPATPNDPDVRTILLAHVSPPSLKVSENRCRTPPYFCSRPDARLSHFIPVTRHVVR